MTTVTLNKMKKQGPKRSDGTRPPAHISWVLRWTAGTTGTDKVRWLSETIGDAHKMTKRDAEAIRHAKQIDFDRGTVPVARPDKITLGAFRTVYLDRRAMGEGDRGHRKGFPKLAATTIFEHDMALRYLIEYFGSNAPVGSITSATAGDFVDALEAGTLAAARRNSKKYIIGPQRVKGVIRTAKAIMNFAAHFDFIAANPFADFDGGALPVNEPLPPVPLASFETLIADAPIGWQAMFALCRLAGLRRGEACDLEFAGTRRDAWGVDHEVGIDLDRRIIAVMGTQKTARNLKHRTVPMCPRLHTILAAAAAARLPDQRTVTGLTKAEIARDLHKRFKAAGVTRWRKPLHSMRTACENEWKAAFPEATYCSWIGHSPTVSRGHYVSPTADEIAAVTGVANPMAIESHVNRTRIARGSHAALAETTETLAG